MSLHISHSRLKPVLQRMVVWCLLLAVPMYGLSASLVELLGPRHSHVQVADTDVMQGWQDFRRLDQVSLRPQHAHQHASLERHHHDADDGSVQAADSVAPDTDGASPAGSAALVLALCAAALTAALSLTAVSSWTMAGALPLRSRCVGRLERPPRLA